MPSNKLKLSLITLQQIDVNIALFLSELIHETAHAAEYATITH